jgi:hypothetical protein
MTVLPSCSNKSAESFNSYQVAFKTSPLPLSASSPEGCPLGRGEVIRRSLQLKIVVISNPFVSELFLLSLSLRHALVHPQGNPNARTSVFKVASPSGEGNPHQVLAPSGFTSRLRRETRLMRALFTPSGFGSRSWGKPPRPRCLTATHWLLCAWSGFFIIQMLPDLIGFVIQDDFLKRYA